MGLSRPEAASFVAVVVPARNEEALIGACCESILTAGAHRELAGVEVRLVVVADGCTDATVSRALDAGATVLEADVANVGACRDLGMHQALTAGFKAGHTLGGIWVATTDADSVVPTHWLAAQLAWRRRGAEAVAGTVAVADWSEHGAVTRRRFEHHQRRVGLGHGHGHVHGANLGLDAASFLAVGGVPHLEVGEDVALWRALRGARRHVVHAGDLVVTTSARRDGRAPGGFHGLLSSLVPPG